MDWDYKMVSCGSDEMGEVVGEGDGTRCFTSQLASFPASLKGTGTMSDLG